LNYPCLPCEEFINKISLRLNFIIFLRDVPGPLYQKPFFGSDFIIYESGSIIDIILHFLLTKQNVPFFIAFHSYKQSCGPNSKQFESFYHRRNTLQRGRILTHFRCNTNFAVQFPLQGSSNSSEEHIFTIISEILSLGQTAARHIWPCYWPPHMD
jgi:hypothetical protein